MGAQFEISNMNNIIIRITENVRQVAILTTSLQSKEASPMAEENHVKFPLNASDEKNKYISLKSKCFEKYRNFTGMQQLQPTQNREKSDLKNTVGEKLISREFVLNKETKEGLNSRNPHIASKSMKPPTEHKSNIKSIPKSEKIKITTQTKREENVEETFLEYPSIKSVVNKIRDFYGSVEVKQKHNHPNRRLESVRAECDLPVKRARRHRGNKRGNLVNKQFCTESPSKQPRELKLAEQLKLPEIKLKQEGDETSQTTKIKKPREIKLTKQLETPEIKLNKEGEEKIQTIKTKHSWQNILDCSQFKKEETFYMKEQCNVSGSDEIDIPSEMDYQRMLIEFVKQTTEEKEREEAKGEILYENRVTAMMGDPNSSDLIKEFYIPPALVEVFRCKLAQGHTAEESLRKLCEMKKWPEPTFVCKTCGKEGWLYSCTLKSKTFLPTKPASNQDLAKELAVLECLDWLGIQHHASQHTSPFDEVYLSWRDDVLK